MNDKGFIWNPSNCECEYDIGDIGEYNHENIYIQENIFYNHAILENI